MIKTAENHPAGLYVHVPFCRMKCRYCDFYSITSTSRVNEWLGAVEREAIVYKDRFSLFDTLYLGGGTPSLLAEEEIVRLVEGLLKHLRLSPGAEATLEANPNDLTTEKLDIYRQLGFNRISLGVQSLDDRDLEFLGRRHTAREAVRAMELIRTGGFPIMGIDLIYGLPGQTDKQWESTLRAALAFGPHHISCYQLTVSRRTALWKMKEAGIIEPLEEERERGLFLTASEVLEGQGFSQYEVSNYARRREKGSGNHHGENLYACRHNLKYWERAPYLGLGPSAHSFSGSLRWWNHRSVRQYCLELDRGTRPVQGSERLSEEEASLERLSLGLRTGAGTPVRDLYAYEKAHRVLPWLLEGGFLELKGGRAVPTREGLLVADRLPLLFF